MNDISLTEYIDEVLQLKKIHKKLSMQIPSKYVLPIINYFDSIKQYQCAYFWSIVEYNLCDDKTETRKTFVERLGRPVSFHYYEQFLEEEIIEKTLSDFMMFYEHDYISIEYKI